MIQKLEISGVHMTVGDDLRRYVLKKIGKLDKYMPAHALESVRADVKLKERNAKDKNERTCEVILRLPQETITINETTINIYAAIDIAEEKLKIRLRKYKERHSSPRLHQRVLSRLGWRRPAAADATDGR